MSVFNEVNDLAAMLVYGKNYDSPRLFRGRGFKPTRLHFKRGGEYTTVSSPKRASHTAWSRVANKIDSLVSSDWELV